MKKSFKQWATLIAICMAGGTIFKLAYLRDVFYVAMQEAFGFTNTQFGLMMTAFAVTQFIAYLPGGWITDLVPVKYLIPVSLISTGLCGFWLATYPPFTSVLIIQAVMGITITLLFWEAMIKGTRMIGTAEEQGRMFGLLEGGRGLFATIISFAALWMFTNFGEGRMGLRATMIFYAIALCGLGVVCFFLIEKNDVEGKVNAKEALDGLVHVAKLPRVWVAGGIVFFGYSFYNGLSYFSSYLTEICGMSVSMGVAVNIVRQYLIAFIAAPIGGMIADKMGSSINYLKIALTLGTILTGIYLVIPTTMGIVVVVGLMLVLAAVMMTIRGTYYATTDEIQIPIVMSGTAAGILSIVGNTPDLFIFTLYGYFMDAYPGIQGYRYIFIAMMVFAVLGVGCCFLLAHMKKKIKSN
ncbi:MFS transporter [Enterocloster lavalensis]|uniref:MFS transporter n=1 Tax=Enterocloster lavalensis TaxID=460384 RepID=UPI00398449E8